MKCFFAAFLGVFLGVLLGGASLMYVHHHYPEWFGHHHRHMNVNKTDCMGCSCGCKESGTCDCAKKDVDCPCKCGCDTSGKCDCKSMKK